LTESPGVIASSDAAKPRGVLHVALWVAQVAAGGLATASLRAPVKGALAGLLGACWVAGTALSGELARVLWRRAMVFLEESEALLRRGHYDVALVMAEQAAQLGIKAVYVTLLGYSPRGHSLRRLLGYLASVLEEAGRSGEAERLRSFAAGNREALVLLEDAYGQGRYGLPGYTRPEAERGLEAAKQLLMLLRGLLGLRETGGGEGNGGR